MHLLEDKIQSSARDRAISGPMPVAAPSPPRVLQLLNIGLEYASHRRTDAVGTDKTSSNTFAEQNVQYSLISRWLAYRWRPDTRRASASSAHIHQGRHSARMDSCLRQLDERCTQNSSNTRRRRRRHGLLSVGRIMSARYRVERIGPARQRPYQRRARLVTKHTPHHRRPAPLTDSRRSSPAGRSSRS